MTLESFVVKNKLNHKGTQSTSLRYAKEKRSFNNSEVSRQLTVIKDRTREL